MHRGGRRQSGWGSKEMHSILKDWITSCENSLLYERFAESIGVLCRSDSQRDIVKTDWCKLTYGPTKNWSRKWLAYCERWPTITSVLNALKAHDYRNASHVPQRFESDTMIRGVAEEMRHTQRLMLGQEVRRRLSLRSSSC